MTAIPGIGELTGGTVPVSIWTDFMRLALAGQPVAAMPPPGGVTGAAPSVVTTVPPYTPPPPASTSTSTS